MSAKVDMDKNSIPEKIRPHSACLRRQVGNNIWRTKSSDEHDIESNAPRTLWVLRWGFLGRLCRRRDIFGGSDYRVSGQVHEAELVRAAAG